MPTFEEHVAAFAADSMCKFPHYASMQCINESARFAIRLLLDGHDCELIQGWSDAFGIGHMAVRVNDKVYDWTARQFWTSAPFPRVTSVGQFYDDFKYDESLGGHEPDDLWGQVYTDLYADVLPPHLVELGV